MPILTVALHPSFTDYVLKLLHTHKIRSVIDFLRESSDKICRFTNLTLKEVLEMKRHLLKNCGVPPVSGYKLYKSFEDNFRIIPTGIKSVDELLNGGLSTGDIVEICGLPASGKTQLCNTIVANAAHNLNIESLYLDTKHDFSGVRIRNMLQARKLTENEIGHAMQKIKLMRIYSLEKLIATLVKLNELLKTTGRLKIIVIDSLPSLLYLYLGERRFEGITLLVEAASLLRRIANQHQVTFVLVNLITAWTELSLEENVSKKSQTMKPSLGKYWQTVPTLRLLVEGDKSRRCQPTSHYSEHRAFVGQFKAATETTGPANSYQIRILKSVCYDTGNRCRVHLCIQGMTDGNAEVSRECPADQGMIESPKPGCGRLP